MLILTAAVFLFLAGFVAGGSRFAGRGGEGAVAALGDRLAEERRKADERFSAAESRLCLLEDRQDFHDGFLRQSPLPAQSQHGRRAGRRRFAPGAPAMAGRGPAIPHSPSNVLQFPTGMREPEERPNPMVETHPLSYPYESP